MKNALYVLLGVLAGFILAGTLVFVSRAPSGEPIVLQPAPTKAPIAVHVIGAVPRPGLYEFPEGARIQDAVDAAGGLLSTANEDAVNLAALLTDGQQLDIPYKDGAQPADTGSTSSTFEQVDPQATSAPVTENTSDLININTASAEELDTLPGIGPTTAQKIIDYRTTNGPFSTIEEIMDVSGIGPSTFDEIKDLITV
ncbi:MAG: ComEA family DNA-binding protein [Anaerolineales bacterium]